MITLCCIEILIQILFRIWFCILFCFGREIIFVIKSIWFNHGSTYSRFLHNFYPPHTICIPFKFPHFLIFFCVQHLHLLDKLTEDAWNPPRNTSITPLDPSHYLILHLYWHDGFSSHSLILHLCWHNFLTSKSLIVYLYWHNGYLISHGFWGYMMVGLYHLPHIYCLGCSYCLSAYTRKWEC